MNLGQLYEKFVVFGIDRDPRRDKSRIGGFSDTALLYGNPASEIRKVMVGIDIDVGELLLADKIRSAKGLDLVISHHPQGKAYAGLSAVMDVQVDLLRRAGLSETVARGLVEERQQEVDRKIAPANHMRAVDAARLLDMAFMCVHTPADNHVSFFLEGLLASRRPGTVAQVMDILNELPEYLQAQEIGAGPRLILGDPRRPVGWLLLEMTGGTSGPTQTYAKLRDAGIRTIVAMHMGEEHFKKVRDAQLNVIIAGHISSDTLGLNLILDRIEKEHKLSVTAVSGFRRHRRI
jgi:hypothetical protein